MNDQGDRGDDRPDQFEPLAAVEVDRDPPRAVGVSPGRPDQDDLGPDEDDAGDPENDHVSRASISLPAVDAEWRWRELRVGPGREPPFGVERGIGEAGHAGEADQAEHDAPVSQRDPPPARQFMESAEGGVNRHHPAFTFIEMRRRMRSGTGARTRAGGRGLRAGRARS